MSGLNNAWMQRQGPRQGVNGISLLPQFNVPPEVKTFGIETRPPHLPDRNSPSRACLLLVLGIVCVIASLNSLAGSEPMFIHTTTLARGVTNAVGRAISHANEQAEKHAQRHYDAREKFFQRRRRLDDLVKVDEAESPPVPDVDDLPKRKQSQSALLLRMAALLQHDAHVSKLDEAAVDQFFPKWRQSTSESLDQEEVMHDLILAVSQLAYTASVDGDHKS